jgi:hypothetical protein
MPNKNKRGAGRPVSNVKVPKETKKYWDKLYQTGDFTEIHLKKKIGRPTIRKAWYGKGASQENIDKITAFYKEREQKSSVPC